MSGNNVRMSATTKSIEFDVVRKKSHHRILIIITDRVARCTTSPLNAERRKFNLPFDGVALDGIKQRIH